MSDYEFTVFLNYISEAGIILVNTTYINNVTTRIFLLGHPFGCLNIIFFFFFLHNFSNKDSGIVSSLFGVFSLKFF